MKHAGPEAIKALAPLLEQLRQRALLQEKRPGVFYLKSRAFLHFHEDPAGRFADLKLADDFARFPVNTQRQQDLLVARVDRRIAKG